ncbi:RnfABCDGE type electron transport complex subunit D [Paenibacillus glycinis]|uniref:RnfABCDGE type electron transport complex subunit D n=1 Tax=Paenibacillus glycinis TaxID=2697035 RepID=A0ABW9XQT7_9BACL|nr:RnfABCDGE type electron transport complex subunit D [Paenibacillus glycinis]NBD25006.1 hypothetical protein [Paenibacillus glycinis]
MKTGQWLKSPKGQLTSILAVNLILAVGASRDWKGILIAGVAVAFAVLTDILIGSIKKRKRMVPDGAVITGLILASVMGTHTSWTIAAAMTMIAIASKHLIAHKKKPVFNPAVVGLLLAIPLFHAEQSWWGAFGDSPAWTIALLVAEGYWITNRVRKFPQAFSFFGTYFLIMLVMGMFHVGDASDAWRAPFINGALFFGFFMMTDPPTSPAKAMDQVIYGVIIGTAGAVVYSIFGGLIYFFIGQLAGNLYYFLKVRWPNHKKQTRQPVNFQKRSSL